MKKSSTEDTSDYVRLRADLRADICRHCPHYGTDFGEAPCASCKAHMLVERPTCRSKCIGGPRPCTWLSCQYHLGIMVGRGIMTIREVPDWMDRDTCALDLADQGEMTLAEIAQYYQCTRERIRQIVAIGLTSARTRVRADCFPEVTVTIEDLNELEDMKDRRENRIWRTACGDDELDWGLGRFYADVIKAAKKIKKRAEKNDK